MGQRLLNLVQNPVPMERPDILEVFLHASGEQDAIHACIIAYARLHVHPPLLLRNVTQENAEGGGYGPGVPPAPGVPRLLVMDKGGKGARPRPRLRQARARLWGGGGMGSPMQCHPQEVEARRQGEKRKEEKECAREARKSKRIQSREVGEARGKLRSDAAARGSSARCVYAKLCLDCSKGKGLGLAGSRVQQPHEGLVTAG